MSIRLEPRGEWLILDFSVHGHKASQHHLVSSPLESAEVFLETVSGGIKISPVGDCKQILLAALPQG